jgi:hypothetical protein
MHHRTQRCTVDPIHPTCTAISVTWAPANTARDRVQPVPIPGSRRSGRPTETPRHRVPNHGRNLGHTKQEAPADAEKGRADAIAVACEQAEFRRWLNEQTADTSGDTTAARCVCSTLRRSTRRSTKSADTVPRGRALPQHDPVGPDRTIGRAVGMSL